ncbi:VOC family protein [Psychrilyobacter atlanticus]|uniref:VOC family protein n=1 Tax=Psychrilyobacter atlanticus TaxID=271091 RepID=UPI000424EB1C|nr:VOC family protein [Psychrilyobacter atlanticus]
MFKRIDHVAFTVKDRAKSIHFYEENFGFKKYFEHDAPVPAVEKIVYLKLGDTILEMVHLNTYSTNQGFHFCLESDNFDEDYTRLINAGVPVDTEPHPVEAREAREEGWRRVVFVGPDGELIEFRG